MSEINNVGLTWMALNNFICQHLMPLHFKGLTKVASWFAVNEE